MSTHKLVLFVLSLFLCIHTNSEAQNQSINPKDVTIIRDQWGVPHIYGKTDADAIYGMTWVMCEDNFDLMQQSWAATRGRAGEILGKEGAVFDVIAFVAETTRVVKEQYDTAFSEDFKLKLDAAAQAANDYASQHPEDVALKNFFPISAKDIAEGYIIGNMLMTGAAFDVGKIFNRYFVKHKPQTQPTGSNGFAISRKCMEEDKTVFVSNSHQPLEGVVAWSEVHVNSEEGWNMLGATFPLGITPFVGTNTNLGWTHTVNHPDMSDIYKLTMHPKKKLHYKMDGEWLELEKIKFKFKVKLGAIKLGIAKKFYKSKHGIVIKNKDGYYALRFSANQRIAAAEQWYKMNKASNFEEFQEALKMQQIPCFNVVYADKEDNIYNLGNGLIPDNRQEGFNWRGVMRGDTSANIWQASFYSFDELPQIKNPKSGYIFNSNNTPFTATKPGEDLKAENYPNELMGYLEKETNRSLRFLQLAKRFDEGKVTMKEFKAMKSDIQYHDTTFYTYNIENLDLITRLDPEKYPDIADVLALIGEWDRSPDMEDDKVAVFSVAFTYIIDELADRSTLLEANTLPEEIFVKALRKAKKYVLKHYGTIYVPFGKIHIHRRTAKNTVSYPSEGMPENLAAMAYTRDKHEKGKLRTYSGESFILIAQYDENGVSHVETIVPFGASNDPKSVHYSDQMEMFTKHEYKKMTMDRTEIEENAERTYHPMDKESQDSTAGQ